MIIGAGQMGSGIAQVFAQSGYKVLLNDINGELLVKSTGSIAKALDRLVEKNKINIITKDAIMRNLEPTLDLTRAAEVDLVVEAATEKSELKKSIFAQLDKLMRPDAVLASNTSSIPITELAKVTGRPDKVIGMHFSIPAPVMKLVEIIKALQTSEETYNFIADTTIKIGKVPVRVKDSAGFALNRVLIPMINEAVYAVNEGIVSIEDMDTVMKLGSNQPMGPLALGDLIGLDTVLAIMETLHKQLGDDKYRPCPLLRSYVLAGWLGVKCGRGFYNYGG